MTVLVWEHCNHLGPVAEGDTLTSTVQVDDVRPAGAAQIVVLHSQVKGSQYARLDSASCARLAFRRADALTGRPRPCDAQVCLGSTTVTSSMAHSTHERSIVLSAMDASTSCSSRSRRSPSAANSAARADGMTTTPSASPTTPVRNRVECG